MKTKLCGAEYCEHPQCNGLTNMNTEAEQILLNYRKGEKVKIGLYMLEKTEPLRVYSDGFRSSYARKKFLDKYMAKYLPKYNAKQRYIRNREKAFAYRWTLQIEWLLKNEHT